MGKLLIVDGNAILHRAYHAIPPLNTDNGEPINAVHGMVSMLLRLVDGLKPTHIVFAFDRKEPTFRKREFENYQSQRPPTEDNLSSQFEKAKEVLRVMNIPYYDKAGYEADDIIGTLTNQAVSHWPLAISGKKPKAKSQKPTSKFDEVVIVTGDKDQLQLVNEKVKLFMPVSGISTGKIFGEKEVEEKMSVTPSQIVDYKGLVGDPSDNYPGVYGIGPKTAINLIKKYGSFPNIYENIRKISTNISEKLVKGEKGGRISYKLAKIVTDVPFDFDFDDMNKWQLGSENVVKLFRKYGFRTLTNRVQGLGSSIESKAKESGFKTKLTKEEMIDVVLVVAKKLNGLKYAIRGTASMVLQGLDMGVSDIDIVCDKKTALLVNGFFTNEMVDEIKYSESDKFKSYFGKLAVNDILVEIMGEWQIKLSDKQKETSDNSGWSKIYRVDEDEVIEIEVGGIKVPVTKLEVELKMSAEMGRWNEFNKIKREIAKSVQPSFL